VILANVFSLGKLQIGIARGTQLGVAVGALPAEDGGLDTLFGIVLFSRWSPEGIDYPALLAITKLVLVFKWAYAPATDFAALVNRQAT
jgi:hypothetical protein